MLFKFNSVKMNILKIHKLWNALLSLCPYLKLFSQEPPKPARPPTHITKRQQERGGEEDVGGGGWEEEQGNWGGGGSDCRGNSGVLPSPVQPTARFECSQW